MMNRSIDYGAIYRDIDQDALNHFGVECARPIRTGYKCRKPFDLSIMNTDCNLIRVTPTIRYKNGTRVTRSIYGSSGVLQHRMIETEDDEDWW